ncbi:MAG: ATP-binding response regulator [Deferrisomatales bacterium]
MSRPAVDLPLTRSVCDLLRREREHLSEAYVRILAAEVGPHYATRPVEELRATTGQSVSSDLAVLCAGDWGPMAAFIREIAETRFPQRFPLSEVQKAFAVFREVCRPLLTAEFRGGEELNQALWLLDRTVDQTINRFSDVYQELHLEELQATSAELAEAHRRLRAQYEEVAEAARIKSQFFANMSHELRSPLNSIIGYTELLLDGVDGPLAAEQTSDLRRILAGSRHLLKLINNILDMTRIEAGRMEVEARPFDLEELVAEAMDTVGPLAYRKKLVLRTEGAQGAGAARSDPDKLKQVLINLLANAVKFTDEGEVVCTVRRSPGRLAFEVRDTGIGIAPDDQERVFGKFFQVEGSHAREHRGTGLGLPLSRMLVELLGGELGLESELGRGSRFTFWVPELSEGETAGQGADRGPGRPRILVVEDDPSAMELILKVLEAEGMDAVPARDGVEGLALARQLQPSAITLDLLMPRVDGWELLESLKNDPETRDIPVVILSCVDREARGLRSGAAAYLVKPIDRDVLARTLRRLARPPSAPHPQGRISA